MELRTPDLSVGDLHSIENNNLAPPFPTQIRWFRKITRITTLSLSKSGSRKRVST